MSGRLAEQVAIRPRHDATYDLTWSETQELTREFLSTQSPAPSTRFVCFELDGSDDFANVARQVEREVFEESWGNDAAMMKDEYGPYDQSSRFFLAIDTLEAEPAAVIRMIRNSPAGLKTLVDLDDTVKSPIAPVGIPVEVSMRHHGIDDLDRCWDGATAAVRRRYRGKLASIYLQTMRVVYAAAIRDHVEHVVAVLDAPIYKAARNVLRLPLVPLAGTPPFTHMDAPNNQAVYAHVGLTLALAAKRNRTVGQKIQTCLAEKNFSGSAVPLD